MARVFPPTPRGQLRRKRATISSPPSLPSRRGPCSDTAIGPRCCPVRRTVRRERGGDIGQREPRLVPGSNGRSGNDGPVSATESGTLAGTAERKLPNAAFSSGAWILRRSTFGGAKRLSVRIRPSGCRNPRAVGARGFLLAWNRCRPSRPDTRRFHAVWLNVPGVTGTDTPCDRVIQPNPRMFRPGSCGDSTSLVDAAHCGDLGRLFRTHVQGVGLVRIDQAFEWRVLEMRRCLPWVPRRAGACSRVVSSWFLSFCRQVRPPFECIPRRFQRIFRSGAMSAGSVVPVRYGAGMDEKGFAGVSSADLAESLGILERVVARVRSSQMELIREADRAQVPLADGCRSLQEWVAGRVDVSIETANRLVATARTLEALPHLALALAEGEVTADRADALARLATADDELDALLACEGSGYCRDSASGGVAAAGVEGRGTSGVPRSVSGAATQPGRVAMAGPRRSGRVRRSGHRPGVDPER